LAAWVADRSPADHIAAWPPILRQLRRYIDYRPTWSLEIHTPPVRARYVMVTVNGIKDQIKFPAIDEFEVYAPEKGIQGPLPRMVFSDANALCRPVKRTTLKVSAAGVQSDEYSERLELVLKNTGKMTALFCEPHPLLNYRTDLFIDGKNICIPPGESRTIEIVGPRNPKLGLSLAQTGWRVTCWNAPDVMVEPEDSVLLSVGRQDAMTREYQGYNGNPKKAVKKKTTLVGTRPDPSDLPCLMNDRGTLELQFSLDRAQAEKASELRVHTADQSCEVSTAVEAKVNGKSFHQSLPKGLGLQDSVPAHLAFPATAVIDLPRGVLKAGNNVIQIRVKKGGWFTWDAMQLVSQESMG